MDGERRLWLSVEDDAGELEVVEWRPLVLNTRPARPHRSYEDDLRTFTAHFESVGP